MRTLTPRVDLTTRSISGPEPVGRTTMRSVIRSAPELLFALTCRVSAPTRVVFLAIGLVVVLLSLDICRGWVCAETGHDLIVHADEV